MQGVGAGLAGGIHHRTVAAELGAVGIGENRELGDRLNTQRGAHNAGSGTMVPETLNIGAVQQIGLSFGPRAGNTEVVLGPVEQIRAPFPDLGPR